MYEAYCFADKPGAGKCEPARRRYVILMRVKRDLPWIFAHQNKPHSYKTYRGAKREVKRLKEAWKPHVMEFYIAAVPA